MRTKKKNRLFKIKANKKIQYLLELDADCDSTSNEGAIAEDCVRAAFD